MIDLNKLFMRLFTPKVVVSILSIGYIMIFVVWLIHSVTTLQNPPTTVPQPPVTQLPFLERFAKETATYLAGWGFVAMVLMFLSPFMNAKWDVANSLRKIQKQRIRLLTNFEPTKGMIEFFDNRSIYNAIIEMLERLSKETEQSEGKRRYNVCMLLCSPALDYWNNPKSRSETGKFEWGLEFRNRVNELAHKGAINFDICHLPLGSFSGINAMKDFIAVLSNYVAKKDDQFLETFKSLWDRAETVAKDFESWANDKDKGIRFKVQTHTINIPFQIVLVNSDTFSEVVVSFAGRDVLEREREYGVKGFFSTDQFVVKTFHEVFKTYVQSRGRIPYIPLHTRLISEQHEAARDHLIPSYYYGLVKNLCVNSKTFSPTIGNSSKFTVWLLDKLLTTGNPCEDSHWCRKVRKILDVGSGSGVLAIASGAILRDRLNIHDYNIVALDSCPYAQKVLQANCGCDKNIDVRPWTLSYKTTDQGEIESSWFADEDNKAVPVEGKFSNFDLIIADLPFVHAKKREDSDLRFLDLNHSLHQAFLRISARTALLAKDGLIVTAFSSLGGTEDITDFERYIRNNSLQVIQRVEFYESDYMWMVYVLMKKEGFDSHFGRLWWKFLDAEQQQSRTT